MTLENIYLFNMSPVFTHKLHCFVVMSNFFSRNISAHRTKLHQNPSLALWPINQRPHTHLTCPTGPQHVPGGRHRWQRAAGRARVCECVLGHPSGRKMHASCVLCMCGWRSADANVSQPPRRPGPKAEPIMRRCLGGVQRAS